MAGVNVPASSDPFATKQVFPMVGGMVGGYFGGPAGAAAGSKVGGALVSGGPDASAVQAGQGNAPQGADPGAIDRRISNLEDHPSVQLAKADAALQQLPPEYQQAYGPTIAAARQLDAQGGN